MTQPTVPTLPDPSAHRPGVPLHMRRDRFDPAAELARLHAQAPLGRTEITMGSVRLPAWLVTRYREVREVLGDTSRFSNSTRELWERAGALDPQVEPRPATADSGLLLVLDPPDHTRLRRMLAGQFTVRQMAGLRPRVEQIVADTVEGMRRAGQEAGDAPVDLVQAFALPVPSLVICELLGVPYADRVEFQARSNVQIDLGKPFAVRMAAVEATRAYFAGLIAAQRRSPGDNLIGMLIREHGTDLTDDELIGLGSLLLIAGHETTANMLALGTVLLLQHPEQLAALRDGRAPVEDAVEELLRHLTIVHTGFARVATTDLVLGGRQVRAGDALVCSLPLANRDAVLGAGLDRLDLARTATAPHLAFGHGVHHCLGAPLARLEMQLAFPALFRAFPGLRLAVPPDRLEFRAATFVHGIGSVPVTW